jgi:hypothetical protein
VNQVAIASLPTNFPAFALAPAARERIAFLGGEPDRWRNAPDLALRHDNGPDHYIDLEDLEHVGLAPSDLTPFRYEFMARLAVARDRHPDRFPPINPDRNADRTRELIGFLPWTITESYAKLKSAFGYLQVLEELGAAEEIANARENVIYLMGTMGHFVGDACQPLHTTRHFNGWVGPNPEGYTTTNRFHQWIDFGYLQKVGLTFEELRPQVKPAQWPWTDSPKVRPDGIFPGVIEFVLEQHRLVEPLYRLEKQGKLTGENELGREGKGFLARQLLQAGQMLGNLWLAAWQHAPPDAFLRARLLERKQAPAGTTR